MSTSQSSEINYLLNQENVHFAIVIIGLIVNCENINKSLNLK